MKLQEVIDYLNATLMPYYQEDYDNSGFLLGDPQREGDGERVAGGDQRDASPPATRRVG